MSIVEAIGLGKNWAGDPLFEGLSFSINPGDRIGLIGRNGCGKTTLLEIIAGIDRDIVGTLKIVRGRRLGYVPQYLRAEAGMTAGEYLLTDVVRQRRCLEDLETAMGTAEGKDLEAVLRSYQNLREEYDSAAGDSAESRMERFLQGSGLADKTGTRLEKLSGGERNILSLLRVMIALPDLLILDEPGNHLDYAGLAWLETFLREQKCAVLVVSHNRYLLDRVAGVIWELDNGALTRSVGNYSAFRLEKLKNLGAAGKQYKADQKKIERLEELVRRFEEAARNTADPAWGRRLRARRTQLEKAREEAVEKPRSEAAAIELAFSKNASRADIAVVVSGYTKSFGSLCLFDNANLFIGTGERVALTGPNGIGKSTFLKDLVAEGCWNNPVLKVGPSMVVGYCAQHQEVFDPDRTIVEEFGKLGPGTLDDIFRFLSRFFFSRADMEQKVGTLSGGEKNRLQIARAIYLKANFLILDEPTNHLDIPSREAIESGLEDFPGTILVVSHDRYFLDKVADRVIEITGRRFEDYRGNFTEYWALRGSLGRSRGHTIERRSADLRRNRETGDRGQRKDLEDRIIRLEAEQRTLEMRIDEAYSRGDYRKGSTLAKDLDRLVGMIEKAYEEWG